jgi:hypothetical protein
LLKPSTLYPVKGVAGRTPGQQILIASFARSEKDFVMKKRVSSTEKGKRSSGDMELTIADGAELRTVIAPKRETLGVDTKAIVVRAEPLEFGLSNEEIEASAQHWAHSLIGFRRAIRQIHDFQLIMYRAGQIADERMGLLPSAAVAKPPAYCRALTHTDDKQVSLVEYRALASRKSEFDMFVDGTRRRAGKKHENERFEECDITTLEFEMLTEYIETRKSIRPFNTAVGSRTSLDAAQKTFNNARAKVDFRVGRYSWRAFALLSNSDPKLKAFEFRPPEGLRFCVIFPLG